MKAITAHGVRSLGHGSICTCADNSGAKEVKIITFLNYKAVKNRQPRGGIADLCKVVVKKGKQEMRKKVEYAVVVRVKKEYRRPDGTRIKFEDNAVVLVDEKGMPKGSEVKGVVAKEVGERYPKIAGISAGVV
ncbi:MAG: 50S ribosomal protein L14 [Candidatus Diapherotrites archaeon]